MNLLQLLGAGLVGVVLVIIGYLALTGPEAAGEALRAMGLYACLALGVFLHILARPGVCAPRRAVAFMARSTKRHARCRARCPSSRARSVS